jgi:hypothetical protein
VSFIFFSLSRENYSAWDSLFLFPLFGGQSKAIIGVYTCRDAEETMQST